MADDCLRLRTNSDGSLSVVGGLPNVIRIDPYALRDAPSEVLRFDRHRLHVAARNATATYALVETLDGPTSTLTYEKVKGDYHEETL